MDIYNELPVAFPWYDNKAKQQRYRENAQQVIEYDLLSPYHSLLPFQINVPGHVNKPIKWEVVSTCDGVKQDISKNISLLRAVQTADFTYVYYGGAEMDFRPSPEVSKLVGLKPGRYYSIITWGGGIAFYSEVFTVVKDLKRYLKFEFWNGSDIAPVLYSATGWKQTLYLDTFIHINEPEVEVDGERDFNDVVIPTFQKMSVKSQFNVVVPDFIKIALVSAQIHDSVTVTTQEGVRVGNVDKLTATPTAEPGGAYSMVEVKLEQVVMRRTACADEIELTNPAPWG